jgi:hypothetical protein
MSSLEGLFRYYKANYEKPGYRWRDYWRDAWTQELNWYCRLGWHIIPIAPREKKPATDTWVEEPLTFEQMRWYAAAGYNLAVVAHRLCIIDVDTIERIPNQLFRTLAMRTPRGYAFFTKGFNMELWEELREKYRGTFTETPRTDIMYELVPLSVTCADPRHGKEYHRPHVWKVRYWLNRNPILRFREVVKRCL